MATPRIQSESQKRLRRNAEELLRLRTTPAGLGWPVGIDALELLHNLARKPDGAADALKLLHELQVHQVELDMQQEQVEAAEAECILELEHYRALFDFQPVAYLILDAAGAVVEANLHAGTVLQSSPIQMMGHPFVDFLDPAQRTDIHARLVGLEQASINMRCRRALPTGTDAAAELRLVARRMPDAEAILLTLLEPEPAP